MPVHTSPLHPHTHTYSFFASALKPSFFMSPINSLRFSFFCWVDVSNYGLFPPLSVLSEGVGVWPPNKSCAICFNPLQSVAPYGIRLSHMAGRWYGIPPRVGQSVPRCALSTFSQEKKSISFIYWIYFAIDFVLHRWSPTCLAACHMCHAPLCATELFLFFSCI